MVVGELHTPHAPWRFSKSHGAGESDGDTASTVVVQVNRDGRCAKGTELSSPLQDKARSVSVALSWIVIYSSTVIFPNCMTKVAATEGGEDGTACIRGEEHATRAIVAVNNHIMSSIEAVWIECGSWLCSVLCIWILQKILSIGWSCDSFVYFLFLKRLSNQMERSYALVLSEWLTVLNFMLSRVVVLPTLTTRRSIIKCEKLGLSTKPISSILVTLWAICMCSAGFLRKPTEDVEYQASIRHTQ